MADEVEIVNYGEGGVASEATLASLVDAIEKLAASTGRDPKKEAGKLQELHNKATKSGITVITDSKKAKKEETESVKKATSALNSFSSRASGALLGAIGSVAGGFVNLVGELTTGGTRLSDFSQHIPGLGAALGPLVGYLDNTVESFRAMSATGASFNNNLETMRLTSARMGLTLDEFQSFVASSSDAMAMLGGTVTQGAFRFERMNKNLKQTGDFRQLTRMGFTVEEINEGMADYIRLQRNLGTLQGKSASQLAAGSADYLQTLDSLAKLTGKQRDQIQAELNEAMVDASLRTLRNGIEAAGGSVENFDATVGLMNEIGGPMGAAMKDLMDGTINDAENTGKLLALLGPQADQFRKDMEAAGEGADPQIVLDALRAAGAQIEQFGPSDPKARSAFIQAFQASGDQIGEILNQGAKVFELGTRNFTVAQTEQGETDETSDQLLDFESAVRDAREQIQVNLIESGVFGQLASAVGEASSALRDPELVEAIDRESKNLANGISQVIDGFKAGGIAGGLDELFSPDGPIVDMFKRAITALGSALVQVVVDGIKALWENNKVIASLVGAIGTLFAVKKVVDIANGLKRLAGFGGGSDKGDPRGERGRSRGGIGKGMAGIGRGAGVGLRGLAGGLGALANPATLAGLGAVTVAIMGIGKALEFAAPAIEATGPMFEGLGKGVQSSLEGVSTVIDSIGTAITSSITAVGDSIAKVVTSISEYKTAATEATTNQITTLANIPGDNLVTAARGLELMKAALDGFSPGFFESFGSFLIGGQGAKDQQSQVTFITDLATAFESFNVPNIKSASEALTGMGEALKSLGAGLDAQPKTGGLLGGIKTFFTGTADLPFDAIKKFEQQNFDIAAIRSNADIIKEFGTIMQNMPEIPEGERSGGFFSDVGDFFSGSEDPLAPYALFATYKLDGTTISSNLTAMQDFATKLESIPQITNDILSISTKVNQFTRNRRGFNWNDVVTFGERDFSNITTNAQTIKDLATRISEMPSIDAAALNLTSLSFVDLSKGVLALNDARIQELTVEENLVARFERLSTLGPGLGHTAESLQMLADVQGLEAQFNTIKEGLDSDAVRTYNDAIEVLIGTIEELKDALGDVSEMQAGANAAMSNIQISAQNTTEGLGRLGSALDAVISEMRVANEYNKEINRNTKAITGGNIGSGFVSKTP